MKALLVYILFAVFLVMHASGQSSFLPKNLGPAINSSYEEINPVISPDGSTLFFIRANHPSNRFGEEDSQDIWYSTKLNDSTWSEAVRLDHLNIGRYNAVLSISADGNTLLLNGIFNKNGNIWKKRGLSVSTKTSTGWSIPQKVKVPKLSKRNKGMRSTGSMSADGKYLLLSFSKVYNSENNKLYLAGQKKNGRWKRPKRLKDVAMQGDEESPFLSADNKTLYFSSNASGNFEIYQSFRKSDDMYEWSTPKKLSDTINTRSWEGYFKTTSSGSWAYFASDNASFGNADLFKIKLFENNPFVVVSGKVINDKTKTPITGKAIIITIDGKAIDSVKVQEDASYKLTLPLGKSYSLSSSIPYYTSNISKVDVVKEKEFKKLSLNLTATPFPYVLIRGYVKEQESGTVVSSDYNPKILINGKAVDSLKYNSTTGEYSVRLNHGNVYEMMVSADRHQPVPQKLDLSSKQEYEEMNVDLLLSREKMAVVAGKILDKKTGNVLAKVSEAKIKVEGQSAVIATIDTLTGNYELRLPLGATYTISAEANNYYPLYENIDLTNEKTDVKIIKDLIIVPIEVGQSIKLNNIFFEIGKAVLMPASFAELDRVAEFLTKNDKIKIEIGGHTDNVGKAASNQKLSQKRAEAVAAYLIKKGISKERVVSKGYGSSKPVTSNATKEGKAQNRRVEFTVLDN